MHPRPEPAWTSETLHDPHAAPDKARRVRAMFSAIAPTYDLNNRIHSFGRDQAWRRKAVRLAAVRPGDRVLDVACGTGDLAIAFADRMTEIEDIAALRHRVLGLDFTFPMLPLAREKWRRRPIVVEHEDERFHEPAIRDAATWISGDATALPLPDASVDIVSIAFGLRNVARPGDALAEFHRVLRPGGRLVVLEFSVPANPIFRLGYHFYCGWLMPRTAALIARDRSGAYRYLPRSVSSFADASQLTRMIAAAGFTDAKAHALTMGVATCHVARKV